MRLLEENGHVVMLLSAAAIVVLSLKAILPLDHWCVRIEREEAGHRSYSEERFKERSEAQAWIGMLDTRGLTDLRMETCR